MSQVSGGNRMLAMIGNGLAARGHEITYVVLSHHGPGALSFPVRGDVVWATPAGGSRSIILGILTLAKQVPRCDVIVANFCMTSYATFLARRKGLPVYLAFEDESLYWGPDRPRKNMLEHAAYRMRYLAHYLLARYSYKLPMPLITISQSSRQKLTRRSGRDSIIVHPGVNREIFKPCPHKRRGSQKKILWVGDSSWRKGLKGCLRAVEIVAAEQPEVELTLVCSRPPSIRTPFPCRILSNVSDAELANLYAMADVFVHSSLFEGFGMPALEAVACGTPIVATDSGGIREFLVDGENALLVPPQDPHKLASAILTVLGDAGLAGKFVQAGLKTADILTWEATQDAFEKALLEILTQNRRGSR